ncbi:MAG: hypothetical protein U1F43_29345 [Myxococcota bacterium]
MGRNDQLDARSDVFTLGLILQEVVTLQRARDGETVVEVLLGAIEATRRPIEHVAGRPVARELRAIIEKAAAVDPAERYATVDALAEDVRRHIRGDAVSAAPDSLPRRVARWIAKNRMKAMVALFMTVIVIPLGGVITGLLLHDAKVEALHQREESLTALTSEVAVRAAELDAELYWYEGVASDVAGAMSVLAAELGEPAARARLERHLAALIGSEGLRGRSSRHIARIRARDVSGQLALASASPSAPPAEALTLAIPEAAGWAASGAGTRFVARYTTPVRVSGVGVIGAVEVEVGTDSLHDDLDVPAAGSVLETLLLRPDGEIAGHVVHGAAPLDLQPVLAELAPKLAAPSDWIEVETGGKDLLVAWHRVQALGWSFVVVVDRAQL